MFAQFPRTRTQRRGIVLVLVLAMMGLLALIGVTFATLSGQAEANLPVKLVETGATTTADNSGQFHFAGIPLTLGSNPFHVQATDAAGNVGSAAKSFTRIEPPCVFNDLTGWTIDEQGGSPLGHGTATVAGVRVVLGCASTVASSPSVGPKQCSRPTLPGIRWGRTYGFTGKIPLSRYHAMLQHI